MDAQVSICGCMWVYVGASEKWTVLAVQSPSMMASKDSGKEKYSQWAKF